VQVSSPFQNSRNLHKKGVKVYKFTNIFISLALFFLVGCATQNDAENAAVTNLGEPENLAQDSGSEPDPNEMICRREQVTGSNFRREVCMTRAQREEFSTQTQEFMEINRTKQD